MKKIDELIKKSEEVTETIKKIQEAMPADEATFQRQAFLKSQELTEELDQKD